MHANKHLILYGFEFFDGLNGQGLIFSPKNYGSGIFAKHDYADFAIRNPRKLFLRHLIGSKSLRRVCMLK